jgi:sorbitol-specific phosphotransferase system component IIA
MSKSVIRGRIGNYTRQHLEQIIKNASTEASGDITAVVAGTGLSGGASSATATLHLDVSELAALGTAPAASDYVVIEDVTDNSTKKVLISSLPGSATDIDAMAALPGASVHLTQDHFMVSDAGTEKKVLFEDLQNSIFANVSGDASIAASGSLTIATNAVEGSMINSNAAGDGLGYASNALKVNVDDGTIEIDSDTLRLKDNGTTLAKIEDLARGSIIHGNASAATAELTKGSANTVLSSDGADISYTSVSNAMLAGSITADKLANEIFADLEALGSVGADGKIIVGNGSGSFAYEDGATARTSLGLGTANSPQFTGLTLTGTGSVQGDLTVTGHLTVNGTTTTVNSTEVTVVDKALVLASGSANPAIASAGGAGLKFGHESGAGLVASLLYDGSDSFDFTDHVNVATGQGYQINDSTIIQETANFLVITGSANGIALSGSSVNVEGSLSASINVSGSEFHGKEYYGDGSKLTGVTGTVSALANAANDRLATFSSATALNGESNLTFNSSNLLTVLGNMTASINVSASGFYGDGSNLTSVNATTVTISDNESTDETNALIFTSGADIDGGNIGLESDGDLTYNPSSGLLAATNITASTVSSSFYGDGTHLTNVGVISAIANGSNDRLVTFSSADALNGESNLTFDSSNLLTVLGNITASVNVSASAFYGDGSNLSGIAGTITALNNQAANRLVTIGATTTELDGEASLTYDGTTFVINDDARINDDLPLYFGTQNDAYIKYNETADDFLVISGSGNGIALSGSTITNAGFTQLGGGAHLPDEQKLFFGTGFDAFIRYSDPGVLDDYLTISGSATGIVLSGSFVKVDGNLVLTQASASNDISASAFFGSAANMTNVPVDLNSLSAAVVNAANDSIAILDADDSTAKKESIVDFVTAIQGDGLQSTSGVINIDVSDFAGKGLKDDASENLDLDVSDSSLTTATGISSGDLLLFSDESAANDPTKNITVDDLFKSGSAFVADDAPTVASDYALFLKGGSGGEMIKESIADFIGAIAGTGIGSSAGQLTHPITAVNTKANDRLVTIGNTTSEMDGEANLTFENSQILKLSGTMVVSSSANHLKVLNSDNDYAVLRVDSSGHTTLEVTGTTGPNAGFTVDTPGAIKLDTGSEIIFQQNAQGFLKAQTNAVSYVSLVPTGSNANVDLQFANSANDKQIATISSSVNTFLLNQNFAFSSPTKLTHPTISGGSSGNSVQGFAANEGSLFFMFSGTGTGDHLTGALPNPVAIGQQCIVVAMSPNSNSNAVVSYLGQSEISSSATTLRDMGAESDVPAATMFFATQLFNADGSAGSVVWVPMGGGSTATGDILGVTAGNGLSGGGSSGTVSLALDLNELTAAAVNVANDSIVIIDADDSNSSKKESIADFVSGLAGTGLDASSGQLVVDVSEVIASDAVNRLLTSDGDGTMTAEANLSYNGTTFTIDDDMMLKDDHKLYFGTNSDSYIEYSETTNDYMTISGSGNGIVLSGSTIQIAGTLEGASPLRIAGEVQFINQGESAAFKFGPNQESKIYYQDGEAGTLVLSGSSAGGTKIQGTSLFIDTTYGIGVGVDSSNTTHAITLPNSNVDREGKIKANAFVSYSSARYKDNIEVLEDPMAVLNQIEGVSFNWKDTGHQDYGFIAEDVGRILPNIVSWEDNKKDAQGMDYLKIISFLVEAAKKQQKEIDELKQRLK